MEVETYPKIGIETMEESMETTIQGLVFRPGNEESNGTVPGKRNGDWVASGFGFRA